MRLRRTRAGRIAKLVAIGAVLAMLAACTGSSTHGTPKDGGRPNIVFVLTDDLSMNLLQYMPHVLQMKQNGISFSNYTVADSLCCPSRSSIFTGMYPHNTHILTNTSPGGGFAKFHSLGEEANSFAVALHNDGYKTAMMGKYLNGYEPALPKTHKASYVPPGWDVWNVVGNRGYSEFNYAMTNADGTSKWYGNQPKDYLTDVLSGKAVDFIKSSAASGSPFMLEVATYAPHSPYRPAPQDTSAFPGLRAPQSPAYDTLPTNPPAWLSDQTPLTRDERDLLNVIFRRRAQAVLAVDRMIGAIENALSSAGVAKNTILVFSSDNGLHLGEYRLTAGKMTAFDTDVNVPLIITGPGVTPNTATPAIAQNVDLAPTFEQLAGLSPPPTIDGRSLVPLLDGAAPSDWPNVALVEHAGPDRDVTDPDYPALRSGNPPTYTALRTATFTYVEYVTGDAEYYDRTTDPYELDNLVGQLSSARRAQLHQEVLELASCKGTVSCEDARLLPPPIGTDP
jgi:arylsulfatase A-like enzyme